MPNKKNQKLTEQQLLVEIKRLYESGQSLYLHEPEGILWKRKDADKRVKVPRYLFHATPASAYEEIKKHGFIEPRYGGKAATEHHPAIFLSPNFQDAVKTAFQLRRRYGIRGTKGKESWYILKIDTSQLANKFFGDRQHTVAVYTTKPIPLTAIKGEREIASVAFQSKNAGKTIWNAFDDPWYDRPF